MKAHLRPAALLLAVLVGCGSGDDEMPPPAARGRTCGAASDPEPIGSSEEVRLVPGGVGTTFATIDIFGSEWSMSSANTLDVVADGAIATKESAFEIVVTDAEGQIVRFERIMCG